MSKIKLNFIAILSFCSILYSCKQSPPKPPVTPEEKGDLYFSGYYWNYKNQTSPVGPGPNRFLGTSENVWVDADGNLHLRIAKKNNFWYCSEIISVKEFGYGTYVFTCLTDIRNFDQKTVFGFFTWDSYSFQTQGNSEVDIEFSKWDKASDSNLINYAVQPVIFSNPVAYSERSEKPVVPTKYISKTMTHMMKWTPQKVTFESYEGDTYPGTNKVASWSFDTSNMPRRKIEGSKTSDLIVIPAPSDSTNARINFWLLNGQAPVNGLNHEIVVKNFKYIPL
jgi:hypothetical protein